MKKLALLCACLAIACGSSSNNNATRVNSAVAKTNVSVANSTPYSLTENAYTTASNSSLGRLLRPNVGKTVSEIKLWQNNEIDERLQKLMGEEYAEMKKSWNVETPIKKFGDFLMMTGCQQHNCADNRYVIFADTSLDNNINVVHVKNGTLKEWDEDGAIKPPPPFADELASMKSHK